MVGVVAPRLPIKKAEPNRINPICSDLVDIVIHYLLQETNRKVPKYFPFNDRNKSSLPQLRLRETRAHGQGTVVTDLSATYRIRPLYWPSPRRSRFSKLPITSGDCLNVGTGMRLPGLVDFDPITADMAPGTRWHPYHSLSVLCNLTCLGLWLELEIQLSRLIRLGLRVHDRRLDRAIHKQRYSV